jgi:ABC-type taurine transport system ATPase subunit
VILWFGIDETAKLFLLAVGVFFPVYLNTFHGIRSADQGLIEMARSYGLSGWPLYRDVILPAALPSILVGVRFSLGLVWVLLIVAETISAQAGIGYMTMNAREFLQTDVVLVGILLYALLGKLADLLSRGMEKHFLRWNPATVKENACSYPPLYSIPGTAARRRCVDVGAAARRQGVSLELDSVSKSFGARKVLNDVQLELRRASSSPSSAAAAAARARCCARSPGWRRRTKAVSRWARAVSGASIRIMFQEARLLPWKSVLENVALGLPRSVNAAAATLATVGLAERADDWPAELSGGQRQRVALRALHEPQLLLLDEPLGALDALTRIEMQQLIESLWLARGFTAVLVTHDVQEAWRWPTAWC